LLFYFLIFRMKEGGKSSQTINLGPTRTFHENYSVMGMSGCATDLDDIRCYHPIQFDSQKTPTSHMPALKREDDAVFRPRNRQAILNERRRLKMARSAHAYVRGSTVQFYKWLDSPSGKRVPQGPPVWICGDCHLGNLGPVADANGRVTLAIRDLDQTVIGNPAHDLIRLALSMATAIRGSDLPGVTTAMVLEQMIQGYTDALQPQGKGRTRAGSPPKTVSRMLERAYRRRWHHLAQERIEDVTPKIPFGKSFWPLSPAERKEIHKIFQKTEVRRLITSLKGRKDGDKVEVVDAAYWVKGCSSLGRLRFSVLVGIGKKKKRKENGFCLIDIKEAVAAAAPRFRRAKTPADHAERGVEGARMLSPYLGQRMLPWRFLGTPVVLRELLPQDLKLEMDQLTRDEAILAARYLASIVGRAHASQMDNKARKAWRATLRRNRSKVLDAPSWLWCSVVELVAHHETAYLEHCRQFALNTSAR
jgi:uncharacterized protein (DUF2252 family)